MPETKARILIVDDNEEFCAQISRALKQDGYEPTTAFTIEEGRKRLSEKHSFDLVLLDVVLPDGSGIDLIPFIKEKDPGLPVIMVSAHEEARYIVKSIQLGASDYVVKPFDYEKIDFKIRELLKARALRTIKLNLTSQMKIIGRSPAIKHVIYEIGMLASATSPVLLVSESGTGKTLIAELIHKHSPRREHPFVHVNCAAIPSELLESEFFGHEKGAFTGAVKEKTGKFEFADKGTIFLDEIGDLALDLQAKLLRVLQGSEFERVGGLKTIHVDVRVIAATNRDLEQLIQDHKFREDLYYRLNVLPVHVPPLRERSEDIPLLMEQLMGEFAAKTGKNFDLPSDEIMDDLANYNWPGNIRELQNVIERAFVVGSPPQFKRSDFFIRGRGREKSVLEGKKPTAVSSLGQLEKTSLMDALEKSAGNISKAADLLHISRDTIYRRLKKYEIGLK